ncbi:unnamed protein product [Brugia timori]|uniref:Neur_chan_memb domain-containing protein n=1 Tax=Brugia timori TaxID=42155 RepID=A0A0R3Q9H5_9BILA|nr:unnamed protein product [Brugia timori]
MSFATSVDYGLVSLIAMMWSMYVVPMMINKRTIKISG